MSDARLPKYDSNAREHHLSVNRSPDADLARHVSRVFLTVVDQPRGEVLEDFTVSDTGFMRVLVSGEFQTQQLGRWTRFHGPILFGSQARPFPARVKGPFVMAGFSIMPGGWRGLTGRNHHDLTDRVELVDGIIGDLLRQATEKVSDHEKTFAALNAVARECLVQNGGAIDLISERFDQLSTADPCRPVAEIAREIGVTPRTMERRVVASLGVTPKLAMRRQRFLDMAAAFRAGSVPDEASLAALRFYDQSHQVREFRHFTGMTPSQFQRADTPLFDLALHVRQRRKIELVSKTSDGLTWLE